MSGRWLSGRGEYPLYVVEEALANPKLTTIQNPAAHLPPPEKGLGIVKGVFPHWKQALKERQA